MDTISLSKADYLDIVYEHRNKNYGSYELRKHYSNRMAKAMGFVTAACISLALYGMITGKTDALTEQLHIEIPTQLTEIIIDQPKIKLPEQVLPQAAPKPTYAATPPKIVEDVKVEPTKEPVQPAVDAEPGKVTATGDANGVVGGVGTKPTTTVVAEPPAPSAPMTWSEQMPEFNGDINAYLAKNLRYPERARDMNIDGKVSMQFVVNEDGSVSNARIVKGIGGGCDEEALRVINSMPKWKPGKQNGRAVKVYYSLPIRFLLQ